MKNDQFQGAVCDLSVNQLTPTDISQIGRHLERDCASAMSNANSECGDLCGFTSGTVGHCADQIAIRNRTLQSVLCGRRIACKALVKPAETVLGFPAESRLHKSTLRIARNAAFARMADVSKAETCKTIFTAVMLRDY